MRWVVILVAVVVLMTVSRNSLSNNGSMGRNNPRSFRSDVDKAKPTPQHLMLLLRRAAFGNACAAFACQCLIQKDLLHLLTRCPFAMKAGEIGPGYSYEGNPA